MSRAGFSPGEAAFFAFADRPKGAMLWGLMAIYVAAQLTVLAAAYAVVMPVADIVIRLASIDPEAAQGPKAFEKMFGAMWRLYSLYGLVILIWPVYASAQASATRWMLGRPNEGVLFGMRFGKDEARLMVVHLAFYGLALAAVLGGVALTATIAGVLAPLASEPVTALVAIAAAVAALAALIHVAVRLNPAGGLTVARGRIEIAGAWRATRGRFWTLLGAHLIVVAVMLAVWIAAIVVIDVTVLFTFGVSLPPSLETADDAEAGRLIIDALRRPGPVVALAAAFAVALAADFMGYAFLWGIDAKVAQVADAPEPGA